MDRSKLVTRLQDLKPWFRDPKMSVDAIINKVADAVLGMNGGVTEVISGENILHQTTDYESLKLIKSNRPVNDQHVGKIMASIQVKNLLHVRPALVNEKMVLIDGQHRHEACRRMKIPLPYQVSPGLTKDDIRFLNTAQKNWIFMDYINYYATEGHPAYKDFVALVKEFPKIQPSCLLRIVSSSFNKEVRDGVIKLDRLTQARTICKYVVRLNDFWKSKVKYGFVFSSSFVYALQKCVSTPGFKFDRLYAQVEKHQDLFLKYTSRTEYLKSLNLIYNKDQKDKLSLAPETLI